MKPIMLIPILIVYAPINYFAFQFAGNYIEDNDIELPSFLEGYVNTPKEQHVEYCLGSSSTNGNSLSNQDESYDAIDVGGAITPTSLSEDSIRYFSAVNNDIQRNWKDLKRIHEINYESYHNCESTLEVRLTPTGSFQSVNISSSSGDEKFDDIAILSILYTNFEDNFNSLPERLKQGKERFSFRFQLSEPELGQRDI